MLSSIRSFLCFHMKSSRHLDENLFSNHKSGKPQHVVWCSWNKNRPVLLQMSPSVFMTLAQHSGVFNR